jgi:flagellar biosynthetic protein FliR
MTGQDQIVYLLSRPALLLPLFLLVLFRISGLMIVAPFYGSQIVPARLRLALAATMSFVLFPMVSPQLPGELSWTTAVAGVFGELLIGFAMGISLALMFAGVKLAGRIMGQQAGLALAQVVDPITNSQSTLLGQLFFWVATAVFLIRGGHRELAMALLDTFQVIPVLSLRFDPTLLDLLVDSLDAAYALALRMAGPVLIALLLTSIIMGFLSRTMPQLNILTIGFAIRAFVALTMAGLVVTVSEGALSGAMEDWIERIRLAFGLPV